MAYKVTEKVTNLVQALFNTGYGGEAVLTTSYCSGAAEVIGGNMSVQLSGFCKETLCIVEDTDTCKLVFVGRYHEEWLEESVEGIVQCAWGMYQSYKPRGYSMPHEFEELFKKYGYLKQKVVPAKTVWEEA